MDELGGIHCECPGKARRGRGREATYNGRSAGCGVRDRNAGRARSGSASGPAKAHGLAAGNGVQLVVGESEHHFEFWHFRIPSGSGVHVWLSA